LYGAFGKRLLDLTLGTAALVLFSPMLAITAVLVRFKLGRPALFRQVRAGLHGRIFEIVKFRSMTNAVGADGLPLPDAERLTAFGSFLRRSSLDELPEIFNVIRGEMSLIGPRPLFVEYLPRYTPGQARRHDVRPGITGWAQVNGRNAISWEEKFALDIWYVDHAGLWLDLKILGMTLLTLLRREGISAEGHATMSVFMGTKEEPK
jgi:lipopolysaccharide/colanic/teichoic acid biosynthesis glycosyltransferase